MDKGTLWSRVGDWIKHPKRSLGWDAAPLISNADAVPHGNGMRTAVNGDSHGLLSFGFRRRMEDRSRQVTELLESLLEHLSRQTQVSQSTHQTLVRLAEVLGGWPGALEAQNQVLAALAQKEDGKTIDPKLVQEGLAHLSAIRDLLRDNAAALARHAESSRKADETVAAHLTTQRQILERVADSSDPIMRTVSALRADVGSRGEELAACVELLNSRLARLAMVALGLGLLAAVVSIIALVR